MTTDEILEQAAIIRDETAESANTAARVGKLFVAIAEILAPLTDAVEVYQLGNFSSSGSAENAAKDPTISGNNKLNLIRYTVSSQSKQGFIFQQVGDTRTFQILLWDAAVTLRTITFSDKTRTSVVSASSWKRSMPVSLNYDDGTLTLKDIGGTVCGSATIPDATTSRKGLLTVSQAKSLADLPNLVRGKSEDSNAQLDPFLYLGNFTSLTDALSYISGGEVEGFDTIDFTQTKWAGNFRFLVNGVFYQGCNFVGNFAAKNYVQMLEGAITLDSGGEIISAFGATYALYWRTLDGDTWGAWQKYDEGGDVTVVQTTGDSVTAVMSQAALTTLFNTRGIYELGDFSSSGGAESAAKDAAISGNNGITLMRYTVSSLSKQGLILQQVGNTRTVQFLFWDAAVTIRTINFSSSARTSVSSASSWSRSMPVNLAYSDGVLTLTDIGGTSCGSATIPEATTSRKGLMTADQAARLGYAGIIEVAYNANNIIASDVVANAGLATGKYLVTYNNAGSNRMQADVTIYRQNATSSLVMVVEGQFTPDQSVSSTGAMYANDVSKYMRWVQRCESGTWEAPVTIYEY